MPTLALVLITMLLAAVVSPLTARATGISTGTSHTTDGASEHLIFDDEFNGSSVDTSKWNVEDFPSPRNNEPQYYAPSDVSVANGALSLTTEHRSYQGMAYTSGAVDTYEKFSFTYGRVDIRAQEPKGGNGVWPALWLLGNGCSNTNNPCGWPAAGSNEMDIMEQFGDPTKVQLTPHWGDTPGVDLWDGRNCDFTGPDFSAGYHTFSVDWAPGGIFTWSIDGVQRCTMTIAGNYFNTPMYLIMNTAINPNQPAPTTLPQYQAVDYVRVYQNDGGSPTGHITGYGGKCVDVAGADPADGTAVQLYGCNGTNAQSWTVAADGTLQALGKCMDVTWAGTANGTPVQLYDCNGTAAQRWRHQSNGELINPNSGRCLDAAGPSSADGTRLQIWDCYDSANQQWNLPQ